MLRFDERKVAKEEVYGAKKAMNSWDVNVNKIVISNLIEAQNNFKYLIGYFDEFIRLLVLMLPKMSGYVTTFKNGDRDKDNNKNNELMFFHINNEKLLESVKTFGLRLKNSKNIELNALSVYGDTYVKPKIRACGDNVYTKIVV